MFWLISGKPGPPCKPFEFASVSSTSISLFWNPIHDDGGNRIKFYAVDRRETDRDSWHAVAKVNDIEVHDTDLKPGKEYVYRIRYEIFLFTFYIVLWY